jgi:hypothetical protein
MGVPLPVLLHASHIIIIEELKKCWAKVLARGYALPHLVPFS